MIAAVLLLFCLATGCHTPNSATSPTAVAVSPTAVILPFDGTWTGTYRVEECVRTSGAGSSYCRFVTGASLFVRLDLHQRGDEITGEVTFGNNLGTAINRRGELSGRVDASGHAVLTGRTIFVPSDQAGTTELTAWDSEVTPDGRLTGHFSEHLQFTNAFGAQTSHEESRLEALTRQ
jgi:hypothetical protein